MRNIKNPLQISMSGTNGLENSDRSRERFRPFKGLVLCGKIQ